MLEKRTSFNFKQDLIANKRPELLLTNTKLDICPNCGNTSPTFQHFQNGMLFCFICRKATLDEKNLISAF